VATPRKRQSAKVRSQKSSPKIGKARRIAGGAATGGGINFQAAVTAIAYTYMLRGRPLKWLDGLYFDTPVSVAAETGGAGDDVEIHLRGGKSCEVQVKRGLRSGDNLWNPLLKMGRSIIDGSSDFGVLAVSDSSSRTIRDDLAGAILRIGSGRQDNLPNIGEEFLSKLAADGLDAKQVCQALRIVTIHASSTNGASISAANAELGYVTRDQNTISAAWNALYRDAMELIDRRGRREISSLVKLLTSNEIPLLEGTTTPSALLARLSKWTIITNANFSIFGVQKPLRLDEAWIPLQAMVREENTEPTDLLTALAAYQSWHDREYSRESTFVDPETLGRFIKLGVLVAGPGMGKTTLLARVARRYAIDGIPVIKVKLAAVAARMRNGSSFEEAVFTLGLDGSGIAAQDAIAADFRNLVLLCDGLDETANSQSAIAQAAEQFAAGHPECRVIVTTRPVGYSASSLATWRHYDIVPLSRLDAAAQLAILLREIGGDDSQLYRDADEISRRELEEETTARPVSRSPLLLALAASVIARGGSLGLSRIRLYERLFALVDEAPNSRVPEAPAEPTVLRRFLDVLGWQVVGNPIAPVAESLLACATVIADELGLKPLAARAAAECYLRYWQDVGLVERVGPGESETIAFIHKTFGEFAAARHLVAMAATDRDAALLLACADVAWNEVVSFAALLGLANDICVRLISAAALDGPGVSKVIRGIEICGEADPAPSPGTRKLVLDLGFDAIRSLRSQWAVDVALAMIPAARRFPEEVGLGCMDLISHTQPWTQLAGWTVLTAAGGPNLDLKQLRSAMVNHAASSADTNWREAIGAIAMGQNSERYLVQAFVLKAGERLLEELPDEETFSAVVTAFRSEGLGSLDFLRRAGRVLKKHGRTDKLWPQTRESSLSMLIPEDFLQAQRIANQATFDAIDGGGAPHEASPTAHPSLLALSGFLTLSGYMTTPLNDVWAWTHPYDKDAVRETVQATIAATGIDREELVRDVSVARAGLLATDRFSDWLSLTAQVDAGSIDWGAAAAIAPDLTKIETALHHRSIWVVWMAVNLIDSLCSDELKRDIIRRTFASGRGRTLWAAGAIAASRENPDVIDSIYERLEQMPFQGAEYLLTALCDLRAPLDERLLQALESSFLSATVDHAMGAAALGLHHAKPGKLQLLPIFETAIAYWEIHEKPYPKRGGVVPNSPRAKILEASAAIQPLSYDALKSLLSDSRSDVRELASRMLVSRLREQPDLAPACLSDIEDGAVPASVLDKALTKGLTWSEADLVQVRELLESPRAGVRHAAMSLLQNGYIAVDAARQAALKLCGDPDRNVRERAFRILDSLVAAR